MDGAIFGANELKKKWQRQYVVLVLLFFQNELHQNRFCHVGFRAGINHFDVMPGADQFQQVLIIDITFRFSIVEPTIAVSLNDDVICAGCLLFHIGKKIT